MPKTVKCSVRVLANPNPRSPKRWGEAGALAGPCLRVPPKSRPRLRGVQRGGRRRIPNPGLGPCREEGQFRGPGRSQGSPRGVPGGPRKVPAGSQKRSQKVPAVPEKSQEVPDRFEGFQNGPGGSQGCVRGVSEFQRRSERVPFDCQAGCRESGGSQGGRRGVPGGSQGIPRQVRFLHQKSVFCRLPPTPAQKEGGSLESASSGPRIAPGVPPRTPKHLAVLIILGLTP